jgi:hypothetical protein
MKTKPRLRVQVDEENYFEGVYRKHIVVVSRLLPSKRWDFTVICPDGTRAADGIMSEIGSKMEAVFHALKGAELLPQDQPWFDRTKTK